MANLRECGRRTKIVGQLTILAAVVFPLLFYVPGLRAWLAIYLNLCLLVPILIGLLLWGAGWVIEGLQK